MAKVREIEKKREGEERVSVLSRDEQGRVGGTQDVDCRNVDVGMMEVRRFNNVTMNEPSQRVPVYQLALFVPCQDHQWNETSMRGRQIEL